jgi:hypothetical protein
MWLPRRFGVAGFVEVSLMIRRFVRGGLMTATATVAAVVLMLGGSVARAQEYEPMEPGRGLLPGSTATAAIRNFGDLMTTTMKATVYAAPRRDAPKLGEVEQGVGLVVVDAVNADNAWWFRVQYQGVTIGWVDSYTVRLSQIAWPDGSPRP